MENDLIPEIRREKLNTYCIKRNWVSQKDPSRGSPTELKRLLGKSVSFWSDLLRDPKKSFGADLAREIEEKLDLPKYYLDGEEENSNYAEIKMLDVELSAGGGASGVDVAEEDGALHFKRDFLNEIGVTTKNSAIVKVRGRSMEPTIADKAVVLINLNDTTPRIGNVYAFISDGEILIKRFFFENGAWIARSDNTDKEKYQDITIDGTKPFRVLGHALWVGMKI